MVLAKTEWSEQPNACVPTSPVITPNLQCFPLRRVSRTGTQCKSQPLTPWSAHTRQENSAEDTDSKCLSAFKGYLQSDPKCFWAETVITFCPKLKHCSETINMYFLQFLLLEHSPPPSLFLLPHTFSSSNYL